MIIYMYTVCSILYAFFQVITGMHFVYIKKYTVFIHGVLMN